MTTRVRGSRTLGNQNGRKRVCKGCFSWLLALGAAACLALPLSADAEVAVDCDSPSDFCTGNPCTVTQEILITVPVCDLDFGTHDLVINKKIHVPNNGTLSLKAGSIFVNRTISGRHTSAAEPHGADVILIATNDIELKRRFDVSGRLSAGTITLDAGNDIAINGQLRARSFPRKTDPFSAVGMVNVSAGGTLRTNRGRKIDVRGRAEVSPGGAVNLSGSNGAQLVGRIDARGRAGGSIVIVSTNGEVVLGDEVRAQGETDAGGSIVVSSGTAVTMTTEAEAHANGKPAGSISITAAGSARLRRLRAPGVGTGNGGTITITSGGDATVRSLNVEADEGNGGVVTVVSAGNINSQYTVRARSKKGVGGSISFSGFDLKLDGARASGAVAGGTIVATAINNLTATNDYTATPSPPGCIALSAGGTLSANQDDFDPDYRPSCP